MPSTVFLLSDVEVIRSTIASVAGWLWARNSRATSSHWVLDNVETLDRKSVTNAIDFFTQVTVAFWTSVGVVSGIFSMDLRTSSGEILI